MSAARLSQDDEAPPFGGVAAQGHYGHAAYQRTARVFNPASTPPTPTILHLARSG